MRKIFFVWFVSTMTTVLAATGNCDFSLSRYLKPSEPNGQHLKQKRSADISGLSYDVLENPDNQRDKRSSTHNKRSVGSSAGDTTPQWLTESEKNDMLIRGGNYMDITKYQQGNHQNKIEHVESSHLNIPTSVRFEEIVGSLISKINTTALKDFVTYFSENFFTRHMWDPEAAQAAKWLQNEIQQIFDKYVGCGVVYEWKEYWTQPNLVARILGADPVLRNEIIIISAHIDSINAANGSSGNSSLSRARAPGADDNGSGVSVNLFLNVVSITCSIYCFYKI